MKRQSGFTLIELLVVIVILGILATIGLVTFTSSQARGRDSKRKSDLGQIAASLELYYNDKGQYPSSLNGNIVGCGDNAAVICTWGESEFSNTTTGTIYMKVLPEDPASALSYYYQSTAVSGKYTTYQLYTHLENTKDKDLITVAYTCGAQNCNYGISSPNSTP